MQNKIEHDVHNLNMNMNKITKWSRFKEERSQVVDMYISAKRKQHFVKSVMVLQQLHLILRLASDSHKAVKKEQVVFGMKLFICLKISKKVK